MVLPRLKLAEARLFLPWGCFSTSRVFFSPFIVATQNGLATGFFAATLISMEKPRERGRPPKSPDERKTAELRIRLTTEQRETLDDAAEGDTSTWARDVLLRAAKRRGSN
jgi:hypothetical protein